MNTKEEILKKSYAEQLKLFEEIVKNKNQEYLPILLELYEEESENEETQLFAEDALITLLIENEEYVIKALYSKNKHLIKLCLEIVKKLKLLSAIPIIIELFNTTLKDKSLALEILSTLCKFQTDETLILFRSLVNHDDMLISSLAIETLGNFQDKSSEKQLYKILNVHIPVASYESCDILVAAALQSLGKIASETSLSYLVEKIHDDSPTIRRLIHEALKAAHKKAVPYLQEVLAKKGTDEKIMAAGILGDIEDKSSVDLLLNALDMGYAQDINVLCAIYDSLGKIPSMKGIVCLSDALQEKDIYILTAVITALNYNVHPGVIDQIKALIFKDNKQSENIVKAIIVSKAVNIFSSLSMSEDIKDKLILEIGKTLNENILNEFKDVLDFNIYMSLQKLIMRHHLESDSFKVKILTIDDSKSILAFYEAAISSIGYNIVTAENGEEGYDLFISNSPIDLVLVDMNMPIMDGIEFTKKVRKITNYNSIPIIMVTTESDKMQKEIAKKAGVTDFLTKPFTEKILNEKIEKYLNAVSKKTN